ncbi:MBOAT family protein [Paenibacillus glycinis]|uniref:Wax synthase domain-containing protein n=1 Tax=Paenibacillus glycinis TaxID=2697035 RepID=A0ABW9XQM8_9BACL|nr:MBOAT family protein [Paenibacillus glycinis]NBD24716.1 hypothetical protein [Paenibacillus glycinis]
MIAGIVWLLASLPAAGFQVARLRSLGLKRLLAWTAAILAVAIADMAAAGYPATVRMLAIIGVLLYGMKSVVYIEWTSRTGRYLSWRRWIAFHLWFGMRPEAFARRAAAPYGDAVGYIRSGAWRFAAGLVLTVLAAQPWIPLPAEPGAARSLGSIMAVLPLLAGLSLMLHFGLFTIVAGLWRLAGFDCRRQFRNPLLSRSLGEFWSRRWNLAFSDMTAIGAYRPLSLVWGRTAARFAAFAFSGILHELAISLPVRQGFGGPAVYFLLHGAAVSFESLLERSGKPLSAVPGLGRAWTLTWLILPLPLLFHPAFLQEIVLPLVARFK